MVSGIDFSNAGSFWGSFLVEVFARLGVERAVVSPGSRSAPLTIALARHGGIRTVPVPDERSASFFALGIAKRTGRPVVLACTSGTAAANFFPAIIEARESRVPLIVLTADRPPELRDCASGQTIDQVRIFGHYPRWQAELAVPEVSVELFRYLRQMAVQAFERAMFPVAGPVHLNVPFRDPLAPVEDGSFDGFDRAKVFRLLESVRPVFRRNFRASGNEIEGLAEVLGEVKRPLIVAGPASPNEPEGYVGAVLDLAERIGAPVLADVLSPLRQRVGRRLVIDHYDVILARRMIPEEAPDFVLRLGPLPTSKRLRKWLEGLEVPQVVVEESDRNVDPLHVAVSHLRSDPVSLVEELLPKLWKEAGTDWVDEWVAIREKVNLELGGRLASCEEIFEGKIPWLLGRKAPEGARIFVSNSTPIRDAEYFFERRKEPVEIYFNRGANGIDGIVSTALGIASEGGSTILVTGDLAFLHDQNGFLVNRYVEGGLTVLLINNFGGGIFRMLPVSEFDPPFTEFFLTPQQVDFEKLCAAYGMKYQLVSEWGILEEKISEKWERGVRVLEIRTDSAADRKFREELLGGG